MSFVLVLLCLAVGASLRRTGVLKEGSHLGLNAWLVYVAVPSAAFLYVPRIEWHRGMIWPVLMPCLVWAGSWLMLGRLPVQRRDTRGSLILGCGLGNTSFVGFPLCLAYYGQKGLEIAVVCDQITFLLLSTVGVAVSIAHGQGERARGMLATLFRFPPFVAFALGLLLPGPLSYGELPWLWERLAVTLVPVALFSVGLQLELSREALDGKLAAGLLYKMMIAPTVILGLILLSGAGGLTAKATVLEAAMAPMTTTSVLAVQYRLDTKMSNLLIGAGVPLSLLTTYLWYLLLEAVL